MNLFGRINSAIKSGNRNRRAEVNQYKQQLLNKRRNNNIGVPNQPRKPVNPTQPIRPSFPSPIRPPITRPVEPPINELPTTPKPLPRPKPIFQPTPSPVEPTQPIIREPKPIGPVNPPIRRYPITRPVEPPITRRYNRPITIRPTNLVNGSGYSYNRLNPLTYNDIIRRARIYRPINREIY